LEEDQSKISILTAEGDADVFKAVVVALPITMRSFLYKLIGIGA